MSGDGFPNKYTQLWSHTTLADLVDDDTVLPDGLTVGSTMADVVRFVVETGGDNRGTGKVGFFGVSPRAQAKNVPADVDSVYDVLVHYGLIRGPRPAPAVEGSEEE